MIQGKIEILQGLIKGHFYKIKVTDKSDDGFKEINLEYLGENEYGDNCFLYRNKLKIIEFLKGSLSTEDDDFYYDILDNSVYKYWTFEQIGEGTRFNLTVRYPECSLSTSVDLKYFIDELEKGRIRK